MVYHRYISVIITLALLVAPINAFATIISIPSLLRQCCQQQKSTSSRATVPFVKSVYDHQEIMSSSSRIFDSVCCSATKSNVVDAEFVPLVDDDEKHNKSVPTSQPQSPSTSTTTIPSDKSLLDLSFDLDDEFMKSRIPFIDTTVAVGTDRNGRISNDGSDGATSAGGTTKNNYIDVKLAFMVTLDNVQYGIAIPYDAAAVITYEQPDGKIEYISPDLVTKTTDDSQSENDMTELIAIMATQLQENVGDDLQLQHTPRVLTISGPIDNYTKDWQTELAPRPINATQLLETLVSTPQTNSIDDGDDDPELAFFHNLMKEELGQDEYDKIMKSDDDDDNEDEDMKELMELFQAPFGRSSTSGNADESADEMKELLSTLLTPEQEYEKAKEIFGFSSDQQQQQDNNGYTGLKLISYMFANGKSYSLAQLLQPYVIVGKYVVSSSVDTDGIDTDDTADNENYNGSRNNEVGYFELLLPDEEKILIPRLEEICSDDLRRANLAFSNTTIPK